jgi:uncharacterized protein YcbX
VRITRLHRHPVKSLAGIPVDALDIEPWGAVGDRRWAVVDTAGDRVSAREESVMLRLTATPYDDGVRIEANGDELAVPTPYDGPELPVGISRLPVATDAGDEAAAFLTAALGRAVRLVWQADPTKRTVNPDNGGRPGDELSLADAGPLLLASEASLAQLQEWVGPEPTLSMTRFRPNVVVDGSAPFAEETWPSVRLGEVAFRVQGPCDRCVMTTIDPVTLERGPEPIRTLARHRKRDGKTWFGVWLVPEATGTIRVGDPVSVSP